MTSTVADQVGHPLQPSGPLRDALLDVERLHDRRVRADRLLAADGAGHLVHDLPVRADGRAVSLESRPWSIDPIPVVLDSATFRWLSLAIAERMESLESVLADLYGPRTLVGERIVPAESLAATDRYRLDAVGSSPSRWLTTYAVDVALGADGVWSVVQDLTDAPPGLGYALLDRSVMSRVLPEIMGSVEIASLARYAGSVRRALAAASPEDSPRIVLFSGGLDHPSYVDHSFLAVQLGINMVEGADLVVRRRRLWLRTLDGLEPIDVLYRRVEDPLLDPLGVAASGSVGVPGLLSGVRASGVVLANALGAGVIEAPGVRSRLDDAIARVQPVEQSLQRFDDPGRPLARVPLIARSSGSLDDAQVVIRMFAVHDGQSVSVLPGGSGRVLSPGDDPCVPTAGIAKDVWVLGRTLAPAVGARLPQVDFGRSVPTRVADALYWTNRAAERAEAMARTIRVISARMEQDPGLAGLGGGAWTQRMSLIAGGVRRNPAPIDATEASLDLVAEQLASLSQAVSDEIGSLLTEATTVREFLSVTTGRVLAHLAELRGSLTSSATLVDDLDEILADFAAFAGLWNESTVRGPAWRIGDTGRRLERGLVVLDLVQAAMGGPVPGDDDVEAAAIEVLLSANESLVAYRRRHRSEVEANAAIALIVHDRRNPRSLAACIERLAAHADAGQWEAGVELVARAQAALTLPLLELIPEMRSVLTEAGDRIVERWFSAPVSAVPMRSQPVDA